MCFVEAPVPAVDVSRFITKFPLWSAKVTFSGAQVAPGTPGPPELDRTLQPLAPIFGSVWEL